MPNQRQPINILTAKGRKHLTQDEIEQRRATEPQAPDDDIRPPEYLSKKQRDEFSALADELIRVKIIGNVDAGELARYVVAHSLYARYTKLLRTLPKKKRSRLRELRVRLAQEEGRTLSAGEDIDDEDAALELERSLALLQDKYFNQCETTARALGLNITSRCKLVIPQAPSVPKSNKFDRFRKQAEGE